MASKPFFTIHGWRRPRLHSGLKWRIYAGEHEHALYPPLARLLRRRGVREVCRYYVMRLFLLVILYYPLVPPEFVPRCVAYLPLRAVMLCIMFLNVGHLPRDKSRGHAPEGACE